ncbi:hypothetical protein [Actinoalloteichus spitiensis]|uniref:hypothetical protein n=1 Tax=Actinoalloteichus spitiensis TaxID=252394 RepID=UPI0012F65B0F|nr:hypothetical protein [Actinoalloteichus spitiensis]
MPPQARRGARRERRRGRPSSSALAPHSNAPVMRTQNLAHLVRVISGWYRTRPAGL